MVKALLQIGRAVRLRPRNPRFRPRGGAKATRAGRAKSVAKVGGLAALAAITGFTAGYLTKQLLSSGAANITDLKTSYKFPKDLGDHGNWINMTAHESTPFNNSAVGNLAGLTGSAASILSSFAGGVTNPIAIGTTGKMSDVSLPLPANLSADLDPKYAEASVAAAVGSVLSAGKNAAATAAATKGGVAGKIAAAGIGAAGAVVSGATAVTGKAINPLNVLLFQGIDFRQYQYTWKLSPRSFEESNEIRKIVRYLQWASSPAVVGGLFLQYPHYFMISIAKDGYLHKFQPAVIEKINVNYHSAGGPYYKRGEQNQNDPAPAEVELQIAFKEFVIVTKDWLNSSGQGPQA